MKKGKKEEFIEKNFIVCKECGYHNKKGRFEMYGLCLCCGRVLDEKAYFKAKLKKIMMPKFRKDTY